MNGNQGPGPLVIPSPSLRSRVNFARNLALSVGNDCIPRGGTGVAGVRCGDVNPRRAAQEAHLVPLHGHARRDSRHRGHDRRRASPLTQVLGAAPPQHRRQSSADLQVGICESAPVGTCRPKGRRYNQRIVLGEHHRSRLSAPACHPERSEGSRSVRYRVNLREESLLAPVNVFVKQRLGHSL